MTWAYILVGDDGYSLLPPSPLELLDLVLSRMAHAPNASWRLFRWDELAEERGEELANLPAGLDYEEVERRIAEALAP